MNAKIVDAYNVDNTIVERAAAGKVLRLWGYLCNGHINTFIQLSVEGLVDLLEPLNRNKNFQNLFYLLDTIYMGHIIEIKQRLLGVDLSLLFGFLRVAPLATK